MGLALCKSMVEAQGGRIWFESAGRRGATFYFEVPRNQKADGTDATGQ
jgi:signal transduction histidine kinase